MRHPFSIYLRTYRKKFGLTQREAAQLVGMKTGQIVSRYESKVRMPGLRTAVAYSIVFEVPLRALFPEIYAEVEHLVLIRAQALCARLQQHKPNRRNYHKLRCVEDLIRRIEAPDDV